MNFGSVCSGIEAASVAWLPIGWKCQFLSEIEAFPRAVLSHHYGDTPLHGDFTTIKAGDYGPIDVLVGGTPCQSFSIAGLRGGMADARGNLALEYLRLADRLRPKWILWENVPGVLSSAEGRDFGAFLGGLVQLGYGFAYRVLDAQFFGLAQRRKRVFVVGYLGDWRRAAAVLFEPASLRGDYSPRRETGESPAPTLGCGSSDGGRKYGLDADTCDSLIARCLTTREDSFDMESTTLVAQTVTSKWAKSSGGPAGNECQNLVTHSLRAGGFDASEDGTGRGTPLVAFGWQNSSTQGDSCHEHITPSLDKSKTPGVQQGSAVRRLTPRECEKLQGFPEDYTNIPFHGKPASDGPRYKALGNSMATPVIRWIGRRIEREDAA